jgi:hypothetical protein
MLLGGLLFLLANSNVHSVLLVGSFLIFWFFDNINNKEIDRTQFIKTFLVNTTIAVIGIVLCVLTVYPPFNDAAADSHSVFTIQSIFLPAKFFIGLMPGLFPFYQVLGSLLLFGSTLGLIRRPAALLAAWISLIGLSLFFNIIYSGGYRHNILWLVFLISLYWITFQKNQINNLSSSAKTKTWLKDVSRLGYILTMMLLLIQVYHCKAIFFIQPESRSKELGMLIAKNPELHDATIIADPDYLLEPLSFYVQNRTYLMREQRLGNVTVFTKHAKLNLSLVDILADARSLREKFNKPVVILLNHRLAISEPEQVIKEGYNWELSISPEQVSNFQASTRLLKRFEPVSSDSRESFDVYVLN